MAFQWSDDPRGRIMAENWNEIRNRIRTLENSINIPNYPTPTASKGQKITPNVIQEYKKALDEVNAKNYCREHNGSHHTSDRNFPHHYIDYTIHYYFDERSPHYSATHKGANYDSYVSTYDGSADKSSAHQSANMTAYYTSSHRYSDMGSPNKAQDYGFYRSNHGGCTSSHYGTVKTGHIPLL